MKILYIAGPYRGKRIVDIKRNIRAAELRMEWAWEEGWVPVCPHLNSAFIDGLVPSAQILHGFLHLLRRCDAILPIRGWGNSPGTVAEMDLAVQLGLEVVNDPFPL